jgi:hypothetical protein
MQRSSHLGPDICPVATPSIYPDGGGLDVEDGLIAVARTRRWRRRHAHLAMRAIEDRKLDPASRRSQRQADALAYTDIERCIVSL